MPAVSNTADMSRAAMVKRILELSETSQSPREPVPALNKRALLRWNCATKNRGVGLFFVEKAQKGGSGSLGFWPFCSTCFTLLDELGDFSGQFAIRRVTQNAFPYDANAPPAFRQSILIAPVTNAILGEFFSPNLDICCGRGCIAAPFMPVPKAPVHKQGHFPLWKDNIWTAGKTAIMYAKTQPLAMQGTSQHPLRFGIFVLDPRHHSGSGLAVNNVRYFPFPPGFLSGLM